MLLGQIERFGGSKADGTPIDFGCISLLHQPEHSYIFTIKNIPHSSTLYRVLSPTIGDCNRAKCAKDKYFSTHIFGVDFFEHKRVKEIIDIRSAAIDISEADRHWYMEQWHHVTEKVEETIHTYRSMHDGENMFYHIFHNKSEKMTSDDSRFFRLFEQAYDTTENHTIRKQLKDFLSKVCAVYRMMTYWALYIGEG